MALVYLAVAILAEVVATSGLKATDGFTRPWPSLLVVFGYAVAFYMLSLVLRTIPVGIAYAIWAGLGIVLVAVVGVLVYGQRPDLPAVIGIGLIVAGVVTIQLFSSMSH
ncbi:multidrug efflux SMR transporter [Halomonas sp.]|uniref:DMT family transporter n=1 Tax=Halomonas sp. TaxID=1486246 RepID=UPI0025BAB5E9|nr:multidrug efflux SMR transporter [Halomonas sp.]